MWLRNILKKVLVWWWWWCWQRQYWWCLCWWLSHRLTLTVVNATGQLEEFTFLRQINNLKHCNEGEKEKWWLGSRDNCDLSTLLLPPDLGIRRNQSQNQTQRENSFPESEISPIYFERMPSRMRWSATGRIHIHAIYDWCNPFSDRVVSKCLRSTTGGIHSKCLADSGNSFN